MNLNPTSARSPFIRHWLLLCLGCVVLMVFIGGVTRLTESGLSIVEWKLVTGILPPLSDTAWEAELDAYRTSPQYQQINRGMDVAQFKQIYWLEWLHRLLGRTTGLIFALPFIYFLIRRQMDRPLALHSLAFCLLVGTQGAVGWVMVQSGLIDDPRVHPVKLAMHLLLACILFAYVLSIWLKLYRPITSPALKRGVFIRFITLLLFIQLAFGAFVAGLDAGLSYNTWPLMDGDWIPTGLWLLDPWHRNPLENITMVQFQHRIMAYLLALSIAVYIAISWHRHPHRTTLITLACVLLIQLLVGVFTLLHHVPLTLASAHQMIAIALLAACIRECHFAPLPTKSPELIEIKDT